MVVNKVLVVNLICNTVENVVFIAGIVYASLYFDRFSLLWFLLIPLANSIRVTALNKKDEKEQESDIYE